MEERMLGEYTTYETRAESHEKVDKRNRYSQIIECLLEAEKSTEKGLTAKECAVMMMKKGYVPSSERNYTAPRLTEMSQEGMVEPIGKRICRWTGKRVAVYGLRDYKSILEV